MQVTRPAREGRALWMICTGTWEGLFPGSLGASGVYALQLAPWCGWTSICRSGMSQVNLFVLLCQHLHCLTSSATVWGCISDLRSGITVV